MQQSQLDLSILDEESRKRICERAHWRQSRNLEDQLRKKEDLAKFISTGKPEWLDEVYWIRFKQRLDLLNKMENEKKEFDDALEKRRIAFEQELESQRNSVQHQQESLANEVITHQDTRSAFTKLLLTGELPSIKPAKCSDEEWERLQLLAKILQIELSN